MGTTILNELMAIPSEAVTARIQGVEMRMITREQAAVLLAADLRDEKMHECLLPNGRFIFESEEGRLKALYKVRD